ncbi:MAG: TRAP transporter large permease subunit, partial [Pyramidobacter sp.]|nr:TRAP transporter large permease subunit [Pyramidobacter sp.]
AKGIPVVCTACASAGFVLGAVALSGIGPKIVSAVLSVSGGVPVLTLILIAVVCLILGMGLPTTSAYILAASLSVPALGQLQFDPMAAHMFVFYYAIISNITPPVALAAYAAASIAEDSPNKTGWAACSLGFLAFVIPFAFCYDTGLLFQLDWLHNIISILSGIALVFGVGFSFTGYCGGKIPVWVRVLFIVAGLASMWKSPVVSMSGSAVILALYLFCQKTY